MNPVFSGELECQLNSKSGLEKTSTSAFFRSNILVCIRSNWPLPGYFVRVIDRCAFSSSGIVPRFGRRQCALPQSKPINALRLLLPNLAHLRLCCSRGARSVPISQPTSGRFLLVATYGILWQFVRIPRDLSAQEPVSDLAMVLLLHSVNGLVLLMGSNQGRKIKGRCIHP